LIRKIRRKTMGTTPNLLTGQVPPVPPTPPDPSNGNGGNNGNNNSQVGQSWIAITISIFLYIILIGIGFVITEKDGEKWWVVALVAVACHIYLSIKTVDPGEWGALIFLGGALHQLGDGPVFAPFPFFTVKKEVRTVFQVIVGTPLTDKEGVPLKEEVDDIDGMTILKEREPFRVNFLAIDRLPKKQDLDKLPPDSFPAELALPEITDDMVKRFKNDPLHGPLTCDPQLVFWFDIKSYLDYLRVVHDVKTLSRNISGIAKATLQECPGRITVGMLIAHNKLVCHRLTYRIEQLIGEPHAQVGLPKPNLYWGVNFRAIQIYSPGLPRTVNVALSANTAAGYDKQRAITASEGEKTKRMNEGAGTARALHLLRTAEAIGAKKLADAAKTPEGVLVLQMKTLAEALQKGNVTILPADLSLLASAVTSAKALLGGPNPPTPTKS